MRRERYLDLLDGDGRLLLAGAAAAGLTAAIPACPGWTVRDAVEHTAEVYEHKIACIRLGGPAPDPWPPLWPTDRDPLAWFADAHSRLRDVLRSTDPAAPSWTWWAPDQSAGFWVRRMAQETAVHRADVQSAGFGITPIDPELAVDGIDEVLLMMLAGDWTEDVQPGSTGTVVVAAGERAWRVVMAPDRIDVVPGGGEDEAHGRVSGGASEVLLWLWGRAQDTSVRVSGARAGVPRLRERLVLATQ
ncbi:MAG TPA: maleylpyruvate isomerase family mycothiol-dependent enzyme [Mycobacteriales bacterium]|nr:maleylpyruvate isomerase family mycothiol-dependent enzyme [Mycobacteriales bacterium]